MSYELSKSAQRLYPQLNGDRISQISMSLGMLVANGNVYPDLVWVNPEMASFVWIEGETPYTTLGGGVICLRSEVMPLIREFLAKCGIILDPDNLP